MELGRQADGVGAVTTPVGIAVKFAEALSLLGLRTNKRGDFALPLPKPFSGWAGLPVMP